MKTIFRIWFVFWLLISSSSTCKIFRDSFHHAIIGQNERTIYPRIGPPAKILADPDGGKILIYEHSSKGMFLTPNKSKITCSAQTDMACYREGLTFHSVANTVTNKPENTIHLKEGSSLRVFLDKNGSCVRYDQDLSREVLETHS